jgi:hypothetical protein
MVAFMQFLFRHRLYVLSLLTGICYSSLWQSGFLNFDDSIHFYNLPVLYDYSWAGLFRLFLEPDTTSHIYCPLTIVSFMLENMFWGIKPRLAHLVNLLLFIVIVFQVNRLGRRMGLSLGAAFIGASVFALHPLHVEPVSWVTARKDVLYGVFYLLSLVFYVLHLQKGKGSAYLVALLCAGLAVLAKSMALSLPFVLLLIRWFMGKRDFSQALWSLLPFVLVVEPIALITYLQNSRQVPLVFPDSFLIWTWSMGFYLIKFFLPLGLAPVYSIPLPVSFLNPAYLSGVFVLLAAAVIVVKSSDFRWPAFGVLFYALSTFFLWRYDVFDLTIVADRFMFIPSVGLCLCLGWALGKFLDSSGSRFFWRAIILLFFLLCLAVLSFRQVQVWKNSWSFWSRVQAAGEPSDLSFKGRLGCLSSEPCFMESRADILRDCLVHRLNRSQVPAGIVSEKMRYFRLLYAYRDYKRIRSVDLKERLLYNILRLRRLTGCSLAEARISHYAHQYPLAAEEFIQNALVAFFRQDWFAAGDNIAIAADLGPSRADVLALRAALQRTQGEQIAANENLCRAMQKNPEDPVVAFVFRVYFSGRLFSCGI